MQQLSTERLELAHCITTGKVQYSWSVYNQQELTDIVQINFLIVGCHLANNIRTVDFEHEFSIWMDQVQSPCNPTGVSLLLCSLATRAPGELQLFSKQFINIQRKQSTCNCYKTVAYEALLQSQFFRVPWLSCWQAVLIMNYLHAMCHYDKQHPSYMPFPLCLVQHYRHLGQRCHS